MKPAKAILAVLLSLASTGAILTAQQATELYDLPVSLGAARVESDDGPGVYSASVSGPLGARSQELRLVASTEGATRTATVRTGKSQTLGETIRSLDDAFTRFLSGSGPIENELLLSIGDIRFGGELHVIAESSETLRFDYLKPYGHESVRFGRDEVAEFATFLEGQASR